MAETGTSASWNWDETEMVTTFVRRDQDDISARPRCWDRDRNTNCSYRIIAFMWLFLYDQTCKYFLVMYCIICKFYVNCISCVFCRWYWLVSIEADRYRDGCCWKCCEWWRLQQGWQHSTSLYLICFFTFSVAITARDSMNCAAVELVFRTSNVKAQVKSEILCMHFSSQNIGRTCVKLLSQ